MRAALPLIALSTFAGCASLPEFPPPFGTPAQEWVCFDYEAPGDTEPKFRLSVDESNEVGEVEVISVGLTHLTWYEVQGADRRWDWGSHPYEPGAYEFAFVIDIDNVGYMLDFKLEDKNGFTKAETMYRCTETLAVGKEASTVTQTVP